MKKDYKENDSGITLVALILCVVIILVIAGVSIEIGTESIDATRLNGFYAQLEIVQKRVDDIAATNESYVDENGVVKELKELGRGITPEEKVKLESIFYEEGMSTESISKIIDNFRYFKVNELENMLGIKEVKYNMFINFEKRIVVAEEGVKFDGITYYTLEDTTYFVEHIDKNTGTIEKLIYDIEEYVEEKYKISIRPSNNIGDLEEKGTIKYKKTTSKYWEKTTDTKIEVELDKEYNIQYIDLNNNSIEQIIKIEYKKDNSGKLIKDSNGNNIIDIVDDNGNSILDSQITSTIIEDIDESEEV